MPENPVATGGTRRGTLGAALVGAAMLMLAPGASASPQRAAADLARELGPRAEVAIHWETGKVGFVGSEPGRPVPAPAGFSASSAPTAVAREFLEAHARALGLGGEGGDLRLVDRREASRGRASVRFQQLRDGVPVLGGEFVVNLDAGNHVLSASGEGLPGPAVDTAPAVSASDARATALAVVAKTYGMEANALEAEGSGLWIYDSRLLGGPGLDIPALVWRFEVAGEAGEPIRELVLVDAQLGNVALHFNQIAGAKDRRVCDDANVPDPAGDGDYPCNAPYDRSEGGPASGVTDVNDAYDYAGDTYDFFAGFGRDSLDGAGMPLISTVRLCEDPLDCPYENAFWDGSQMAYGQGFAAADDVVGHELSHGVTEFSSRLFYYYQSGAINESLSDVFGELIDLSNVAGTDTAGTRWLMGEDIPPPIGAIRDMENPPAFGDPDRMQSPNYFGGEGDNGGVHINSGVNNKAAFLMTDGGTFNGRSVTGLGIAKVARIYYEVEVNMLGSASDYGDLFNALPQACNNLVGSAGITVDDCADVAEAVSATEMNQVPSSAPNPEAPICGSGSVPQDVFFDDLENPASGNWTLITDLPPNNRWYYPQNPNPHGLDPTYATSGDVNFWGYDQAGIGDYSIATSSATAIPANAFMHFRHAFGFEDSSNGTTRYDGGVLEYSTDGGTTWDDAGGLITHNGYTGTIDSGFGNPLAGQSAFGGESNGYISTRVDLSSLAGQNVRFRFRIGTDTIVDDYGWFIDDIRVYTCATDDTPPDTTISGGPSGTTEDPTPTFSFTSSEPGSTFECRVDAAAFGPCLNPRRTATLSDGPHIFEVRALDPAANADPTPASRSFIVEAAPPETTITGGPTGTGDRTPTFTFTSSEAGSTFECRVDSGTFVSCTSPHTTAPVAEGTHTFEVRAIDGAGKPDLSPAQAGFTFSEPPPPPALRCAGTPVTIPGTAARDVLVGTPGNDVIATLAGNDTVRSLGGRDLICTAGGADIAGGGGGNDRILAGGGDDRLLGQSGNDRLFGQAGRDIADGGAGRDSIFGGAGADRLLGKGGVDLLNGGGQRDRCNGGPGADRTRSC